MKKIKIILPILLLGIGIFFYVNYPKLNIISGHSAKYISSTIYNTNRSLAYTDSTDLNFSPINIAKDKNDAITKTTSSNTLGILTREAIHREGLGSVLIIDENDKKQKLPIPKRTKLVNQKPYPYGNEDQKDTIFKEVNYQKINQAISNIFTDSSKTRAALVIYKDQIIAEKYAKGFNKESKILGWSMTKSITGTLFGILEYQGRLNINDKAPIKEWENDDRKAITINNLLQMNSGLAWEENYNKICDVTKMLFLSRNMGNTQRDKKLLHKPNTHWYYSSGTSNLLSNILRSKFKTHQEYLDFWYTDLIDKIGMNSMLVETDLEGNYVGSSYAWATPRDWGKLGLLYLHNGKWEDDRLFDEKWVNYATSPTPTSDGIYGAQIWLNKGLKYPKTPKSMYSFNGYQGQYVFILPEQDLVVVRMGLTKKFNIDNLLSEIVSAIK